MKNRDEAIKKLDKAFWKIIKATWTLDERVELRAQVEAWMAADKSA